MRTCCGRQSRYAGEPGRRLDDCDRDACGLVSFGADQPGTITLSPTTSGLPQNLTSIGAPVVYNVTGNLLTAFVDTGGLRSWTGDRQVFTLQITNPATGAYTFTLLDQLDHGLGTNDNDEALIAINLSSVLVATDADGDITPLTDRRVHDQRRERRSAKFPSA